MRGNTFGKAFSISSFGESHGVAMGVVIDGCLPNLEVDFDLIRTDLARRKPGQSVITTARNESDGFEILSGIFEGKTLGTPIAIIIRNTDAKSSDYDQLKNVFRPSHADYTYQEKYGIRDHRGGGRQSARETVARVLAGSFAKMILRNMGVSIQAYVSQVHDLELKKSYLELDLDQTEKNMVRCPDPEMAEKMIGKIAQAKEEGNTLGGVISCVIKQVPIGLGEPVFDKLNADLAKAMFSINAVKGFDLGSGFEGVKLKGSEHNDVFEKNGDRIVTKTNNSGGIQGGISNGGDIYFRVGFKPVASLLMEQESLNVGHETVTFTTQGRHDPCVLPRAVPIVEAMAALVLVDHYLRNSTIKMQPFL
jgi:chorismate synthase